MAILEEAKTETVNSDVLVLGAGIAGCFAAIKAREFGLDVVLVDKGNVGRSGLSPMMSGVLSHFDPQEDNYDEWLKECVEVSEWIADQKILDGMVNRTTECIRDMQSWGVKFQKQGGKLIRKPMSGDVHARHVLMTRGGLQLMSVVRGEVLRRGMRVIERVMATDLLTSDGEIPTNGKIVGAVGFNVRTGKFYIMRAKATIIATGMTGVVLLRSPADILSGDGKAMAFHAGCEMRNMDLSQYSPHPLGLNCAPGLNILAGEGAILVNAKGDRFMEEWDPILLERASRVVVCKAIATEELRGRSPVYFDAAHLDEAAHVRIEKCIPLVVKSLELAGLSLRKDRIPYTIDLSNTGGGGIRTNREKATTIPSLYACGDASDHGEMGVTALISPGIASAIDGYRAAEAVAGYITEVKPPSVNERQIQALKERMFAPMKFEAGLNPQEVRQHCRSILARGLLGPFKNSRRLKEAIDVAEEIRENVIPKLAARDYHELASSIGLGNALNFIELYSRCSLLRAESRGSHWREDYPERDDAHWLKWVVAKREDDGIKVWAEPIPYEEYPLKPKLAK
ncbi:MAG: FAD-binding protein [Chloroflexi bacterium]|nr:FAD-binding protein [Chloroflexota bacterium]